MGLPVLCVFDSWFYSKTGTMITGMYRDTTDRRAKINCRWLSLTGLDIRSVSSSVIWNFWQVLSVKFITGYAFDFYFAGFAKDGYAGNDRRVTFAIIFKRGTFTDINAIQSHGKCG